nr:MAG TPA: hypothetical protein [Caudoviricetes sp.]
MVARASARHVRQMRQMRGGRLRHCDAWLPSEGLFSPWHGS